MSEIKPCPVCDQLPANCTCPPGDRWIPLDGLKIHLTADGEVDLRILRFNVTTGEHIRQATPTILAWGERVYRDYVMPGDHYFDTLAGLDAQKRTGESWGDLAKTQNRILAALLAQVKASDLTPCATREFSVLPEGTIWRHSLPLETARELIRGQLREVGIGEDRAQEIATDLINAVQRGEDPIRDDYPISRDVIKSKVKRWRDMHTR